MARLIQRIAERQPERVALTDARGSTRWDAFNERVNRLISAFEALGLQPGDTIAVFAPLLADTQQRLSRPHRHAR